MTFDEVMGQASAQNTTVYVGGLTPNTTGGLARALCPLFLIAAFRRRRAQALLQVRHHHGHQDLQAAGLLLRALRRQGRGGERDRQRDRLGDQRRHRALLVGQGGRRECAAARARRSADRSSRLQTSASAANPLSNYGYGYNAAAAAQQQQQMTSAAAAGPYGAGAAAAGQQGYGAAANYWNQYYSAYYNPQMYQQWARCVSATFVALRNTLRFSYYQQQAQQPPQGQ